MSYRLATPFALATLLAACASGGGTPPPPPRQAASPAAAPAPAPAGPASTRFDGHYRGPSTLIFGRSNACGSQNVPRTITVTNGQAHMVYDSLRQHAATGPVQPDGSLRMWGESDQSTVVSGQFANGTFTGEVRSQACQRSLSLRRVRR